jgi:WD40 repeat protein
VSSRQTIGGPLPHLYRVTCFAFSPNGRFLLTGSGLYAPSQGEAKLWSIERTAACRHVLQHQGDIESASFSPDAGKTLLTGTGWIGGNTVGQLWDMGTGKPIGQPLPHEKGTLGIVGVAFAADGRTVLTGTGGFFGRGQLRRWDRTSGKLIAPSVIQLDLLESVFAVTVDGARVFTAGPCEYKAGVYPGHLGDSATGKTYGPPLRHPKDVKIATFSRNGALLLTGAEDSTLRLWDAATGMLVRPPARIEGELRAVAFSWDGSRFLTGTSHGVAQVWDATDFKPVGRPMNHEGEVRAVAFSPDGFWVLTGTDQQLARIWDVATSKPIGPALQHQGVVKTVLFSPDGSLLTGSWDKTCRIWNAPVALKADAGRVALSVQLSTGLALDDAGAVRVLNAGEWQECKKTLSKLDAGARTPKIYASMAGIGSRG